MQIAMSDNTSVTDFYCYNDETAFTEDSISAWRSSHFTLKRGIIDGNNSPGGRCQQMEASAPGVVGGLIEDVDAINCGGGCFGFSPGKQAVNRNTRCAHTHCVGWSGRDAPISGSIAYLALNNHHDHQYSEDNEIINAGYYNLCNKDPVKLVLDGNWNGSPPGWKTKDIHELTEFTLREQVVVEMPFDQCDELREMPTDTGTIEWRDDGKEWVTWTNGFEAEINTGWTSPKTGEKTEDH